MSEKHDAHVLAFHGYKLEKIFGGKTISEIKNKSIEDQKKRIEKYKIDYPIINDRVIFRSINRDGEIHDGYGFVQDMHVHDYITGYALYTVKMECPMGETYQLYNNHPDKNKQGEWIRRA